MYWTGIKPNELPVADVLAFTEHFSDIVEEHQEMNKNAVAKGVAKVLNKIG